jgi:hypothetical protein
MLLHRVAHRHVHRVRRRQHLHVGTVDLLAMSKWMTFKGWLASYSTVDQIDYASELVSTNCAPAIFTVNNFRITDPAVRRYLAPDARPALDFIGPPSPRP